MATDSVDCLILEGVLPGGEAGNKCWRRGARAVEQSDVRWIAPKTDARALLPAKESLSRGTKTNARSAGVHVVAVLWYCGVVRRTVGG